MKNFYLFLFSVLIFASSCRNSPAQDPVPAHDSLRVQSIILGEERIINVWLPDQYKSGTDSLPIMYMADGGVKEDFPHIANTLEKLINENKIVPMILVGIENTQRRRDLTPVTEVAKDKEIAAKVGGSSKFREFIKEELFPEIEGRYRTTSERSIIGESLSGLFVMETFFLYPDLFTNYVAFDPSLWWNNHYLNRTVQEHLEGFPTDKKRLWFAGSDATDINQYTKELATILTSTSPSNLKWAYSDEPNEKHHTIFRATKEKALIWAFGD
ncbi:alpha/beta hydrolase [Sphingobacterium cavernae]|uniref:alpha/beta hydrolase n=1 Tax=Sphingobacterium cavernae TaxID=2592657 RepID=UPI0012301F13|nr:alpha/beta hydrolase-fold protein [Sphingobacterium cavernae]